MEFLFFNSLILLVVLTTFTALVMIFSRHLNPGKYAAEEYHNAEKLLADRIEDLLPQTQCGQCGYPGCRPYAEAIRDGEAINQCPPGGEGTISQLANLLNTEPQPLNKEHGIATVPMVAYIREAECIGCVKCIRACPVDAIMGAAKFMHTVIVSECTGCDLCVDPCPVDCIDMIPLVESFDDWHWNFPPTDNICSTLTISGHHESVR